MMMTTKNLIDDQRQLCIGDYCVNYDSIPRLAALRCALGWLARFADL